MSEAMRHDAVDDQLTRKILALSRTTLFGGMDTSMLNRLAALAEWRVAASGAFLFHKDDPGQHLLVIHKGRVKIVTEAADGREVTLNLLGPGAVFGEMAFADGGKRTASAVTTEPCELLAFSRRQFLPFLTSQPDMMLQMLAALCERARWLAESFEDSAFLELAPRLAKRLLFLSASFGFDTPRGRRLAVSLPHRELATHMNVTRESINRLIQKWRQEGIIEEHRGIVVLQDIKRLEALAGDAA
jgi:CRP-like cAMP-binding protein